MKILVRKQDKTIEAFDRKKLLESIEKNEGSEEIVDDIFQYFKEKNIKETTSNEIHRLTERFLLKSGDKKAFLRYNLPKAIYKLGPEGFAFEKFMGQVIKSYGYESVFVGKKIAGKCVVHEMDIVAKRGKELMTAELKFHNSRSKKSDLKVVLYMKARFDDLINGNYYEDNRPRQIIITNTKFTHNAKTFAKCSGVEVIAWNYPLKDNLYNFILNSGVHPITALISLPQKAKQDFVKRKIVSCRDLMKNKSRVLYDNAFIPKVKISQIIEEIREVCDFATKKDSF